MQLRFLQFFRDAKHMKTGGRYTACFLFKLWKLRYSFYIRFQAKGNYSNEI